MRDCGLVASHRTGLLGRVDLLVKRGIRKLFQRHLLQQHRVHLKLMNFLGRVLDYLESEDRVIRLRLDRCEQLHAQATAALSNRPETSAQPPIRGVMYGSLYVDAFSVECPSLLYRDCA